MKIEIINTTHGIIEFSETGTGTPVLYAHGGHGSCRETLFPEKYRPEGLRMLVPSRPGYANTPLLKRFSARSAADVFVALLDALKIESAIIIGVSAGGLTAIEIAANYPERVDKLVLISAVTKKWLSPQDKLYKKGRRMFSKKTEYLSWALFRICYTCFPKTMAKATFKTLSKHRPVRITGEEAIALKHMMFTQRSYEGFVNDLDQDIENEVLHKICCPTLILHSENDAVVAIDHAVHAEREIKDVERITYVNKWGHLLWIGAEAQAWLKDILTFIEK